MNPLRLYDYVYYCIAILYDRVFDYSESREESGILIVSLFQFFNFCFLIYLANLKEVVIKKNGLIFFILPPLILVGLNFLRYKKYVKLKDLEVKFDNQNKTVRLIKIILVIIYVFLSFYLLGL